LNFWDASAVVPLLSAEQATPAVRDLYLRDPDLIVWWGTAIECVSAVSRREREGFLTSDAATVALSRLDAIATGWEEVEPGERLRDTARRLLRVHPLCAADALQLAAAVVASEGRPSALGLVCLDERLTDAARREGLPIIEVG
jgi:hypothetical protein